MKKKTISMLLLWIFVFSVSSLFVFEASADGVVITPELIEGTLCPGATEYDTITVELPPSVPKGDVVFIFDTTGSMSWIIEDMQTKAIDIMNGIRGAISDTAFGVGSFCDYPHWYDSYGYSSTYGGGGDYAFNMDIDITLDTAAVSTAIDSIVYGGGADGPEDYTRAAWESMHYSWREGAKRIVVLFGDAPPHSAPSGLTLEKPWAPGELLFSSAYGGDPGPDEIMFTADDLDYGPVVQEVSDNYITFVCVDCGMWDDATNNFNYLAYMTDGAVFPYTSETIADDIIARIEEIAAKPIEVLTLEPDAAYAGWVLWDPTAYYDVPWGTTVSFDVEITVPSDTLPGDYSFGIHVVADGVTLGTVEVIKHVLEPLIPVYVDVKPCSWPNPIQLKGKGVLPVAICGTEDFDVTTIDPETIQITMDGLEVGVSPLRWSYEDAATPYLGEPGGGHALCGDGYLDLTLKFNMQEVIETLELDAYAGDTIPLIITGNLFDEFDGTPIQGQDFVWIL